MANKYTSYVEEALARSKKQAPKEEPPKKQQEPLFDDSGFQELDGNTTFKDVFGFLPPSGINHKGVAYKDTDWSEDMQAQIPPEDKFTDYSADHNHLETMWIAFNMGDNTFASGPTGSGKSSFYEYWCSKLRVPFIRINGSGDSESDILFGKTGIKDGETVWNSGPVTEGFNQGALILIDEATSIPAHIWMSMHWAMEKDGKLVLNDKEGGFADKLVDRDPRTRFVLADNTRGMGDTMGAFAGTNVMNSAMLNRIQTFMYFDYKNPAEEQEMLEKKFPALKSATAKKIVQFGNLVRTSFKQGEIDHTLAVRDLENLVTKALYLKSFGKAIVMAWIEKFEDETQRDTIAGHYETVFNHKLGA